MSILDRIAGLFRDVPEILETKEAPNVVLTTTPTNVYRKDDFSSYADEGYRKNAIVYRCVNEIANGAASIDFKAFDGEVELEQHPILDILKRPNPTQAGVEYFQSLYSFLLLGGNSYAVKTQTDSGVAELHLLRPDRVEVVPSKTAIPAGYNYKLNGKVAAYYEADPVSGASDVKHFKFWNPLDDYVGLSPLMAAAVDVDQHNMIAKHNVALLMNGARPSGAVIFKPSNDRGMPIQLSDGQRQQLQDDINTRFQGTTNAGRPLLLEGDFDWKEMGISPKDMDFINQRNMTAKDIALCFGVPSQLVGIPDAQTYANVQEARLSLYEETIIPLAKRIESDLNEWLSPIYGERIQVKYDIDSIPAMAERRRRTYENVVNGVREGILTRNEARERLGLEPITNGDDVYIAANLFPLGSPETSEADEAKPEDAGKEAYAEEKAEVAKDTFTTEQEALDRAEALGCSGIHAHQGDNGTIYMPCRTHDEYDRLIAEEQEDDRGDDAKAESDVDTKPTQEMADEAAKGLKLRKEYNRGGTEVGVARAVQLTNGERLSPSTVRRMHSFFSRHEVDKRAEGFRVGEDGYPSAGKIAWLLWGGDPGQRWARRKVAELDKERDAQKDAGITAEVSDLQVIEEKRPVSEKIKKALANKVKEHNDKHGHKKGKRVTLRMLSAVFKRGVGAYHTNPGSVRPNVTGPDQWGLGRVNAFLKAVRSGRFPSGKFDLDLLPSGHPLKK